MPKKIIQKSFSKIIFLIFIFTIFSTFINQQKTFAWFLVKEYDANTGAEISLTDNTQLKGGCNVSQTKATIYAVSTTDLTGTLPLCFYDADTNNTLTLYKDDSSISTNKITGSNSDGTYPAATAAAPNKVNVSYTFPQTFNTEQRKDFFILDNNSGQAGSSFRLTLLPATIGMTVSTSTAGYNYNAVGTAITGSYNDTILPYIGPYQLKYGEQLNFSCDKTTRYGIYSDNKVGFTFTTDLTSANNYTGTTYHRFDQGDSYYTNDTSIRSSLPYSTSALICVNINADNNLTTGNEKNRCLYVFICFY